MKILKKEIDLFFELIADSNLSLAEARKRDAVVKQLASFGQELDKQRKEVILKFCEIKDGEPVIKDNHYTIVEGKETDFNKEIEILMNEEVEITADNQSIKNVVNNTNYKPKVGEMEKIDSLIQKIK